MNADGTAVYFLDNTAFLIAGGVFYLIRTGMPNAGIDCVEITGGGEPA